MERVGGFWTQHGEEPKFGLPTAIRNSSSLLLPTLLPDGTMHQSVRPDELRGSISVPSRLALSGQPEAPSA